MPYFLAILNLIVAFGGIVIAKYYFNLSRRNLAESRESLERSAKILDDAKILSSNAEAVLKKAILIGKLEVESVLDSLEKSPKFRSIDDPWSESNG